VGIHGVGSDVGDEDFAWVGVVVFCDGVTGCFGDGEDEVRLDEGARNYAVEVSEVFGLDDFGVKDVSEVVDGSGSFFGFYRREAMKIWEDGKIDAGKKEVERESEAVGGELSVDFEREEANGVSGVWGFCGRVGFSAEEVEVGDVEVDVWTGGESVDELLGVSADSGDDWTSETGGFDADFYFAVRSVEFDESIGDSVGEIEFLLVGFASVFGEVFGETGVFEKSEHGFFEVFWIFCRDKEGGLVVGEEFSDGRDVASDDGFLHHGGFEDGERESVVISRGEEDTAFC